MNDKILIPVVAALAVAMFAAPALVTATEHYLNVADNKIEPKDTLEAQITTEADIPTSGAFGYGVLTDAGLDGIMVATTHGGVLDSEDQADANDPVWHNHYVALKVADPEVCDVNTALEVALEVSDITFESPGEVKVSGMEIKLEELPPTFTGTSALSGDELTLTPGSNAGVVVSFTLKPVFGASGLTNVCVENVSVFDANIDD